ncbi:hypothetical protein roselon_00038 [Roseibacterium elongatum DSM 19469]|uniref:Periplasmic heavy metal sensor n=1 Tax=Roseicyclus elongatus DSM 19469 TaxID=1294273 RepID=W8SJ41_9RHOB|nr:periplasmic heavy metal sensor [Roseibacterium elongatum]AHM02505.1 hypothetical protein roselon_00038 [Roseibacterium elongatum DSM 19469]
MSDPNTPQTPTPPDAAPRRKTGPVVKLVLAVSLALNVLIMGLVAGAVTGRIGPSGPDELPALRALGLGPFAVALDRDGRAAVRDALGERRAALRAERRIIGDSLRAVQMALRADPFDRAGASAAMVRSRAAAEALQRHGQEALLDHLQSLPLERRIALADDLGRAMRRFDGRAPDRAPDR